MVRSSVGEKIIRFHPDDTARVSVWSVRRNENDRIQKSARVLVLRRFDPPLIRSGETAFAFLFYLRVEISRRARRIVRDAASPNEPRTLRGGPQQN